MLSTFFTYLLAIHMSSLKKCLFRSSVLFWLGYYYYYYFWYWVLRVVCIFRRLSPCWLHHLQLFSPILYVFFFFFFFNAFVTVQKLVNLIRSHWFHLFLFLLPWETYLRKSSWCQRMFCLCSLLGVLWCLVLCLSP